MGKVLMTVAFVLAGFPAMASSIEIVSGNRTGNNSIITISCAECPPAPSPVKADKAPVLALGTQDITVRDKDGKKQLVRQEAWLGGSPVTYVSINPAWLPVQDTTPQLAEEPSTIDTTMTTSAVADKSAGEIPPVAAVTTPPSFEGTALRPSL